MGPWTTGDRRLRASGGGRRPPGAALRHRPLDQGAPRSCRHQSMERGPDGPPTADELRARYRCRTCHKQCVVPCRLTTLEFRQMEQGTFEGPLPPEPVDWS
jgi:hypothetical protein